MQHLGVENVRQVSVVSCGVVCFKCMFNNHPAIDPRNDVLWWGRPDIPMTKSPAVQSYCWPKVTMRISILQDKETCDMSK